jgi:hypothetical protein
MHKYNRYIKKHGVQQIHYSGVHVEIPSKQYDQRCVTRVIESRHTHPSHQQELLVKVLQAQQRRARQEQVVAMVQTHALAPKCKGVCVTMS